MRPSEMEYSITDDLYYRPRGEGLSHRNETWFSIEIHNFQWVSIRKGIWTFIDNGRKLPSQGWKVHLSSSVKDAKTVLDRVAGICMRYSIPFKFLSSKELLEETLAKYGDRVQSGKFVTCYPASDEEAIMLMKYLEPAMWGIVGPTIIGDACWNNNIFFRYGAFQEMYMKGKDGVEIPSIYNPDGEMEPDPRGLAFEYPAWLEVPPELLKKIEKRYENNVSLGEWEPYLIQEAIHFSNAGGVYKAIDQVTGRLVLVKEARPYVGLDLQGKYAPERLRQEYKALQKCSSVKAMVNPLDFRIIGGHSFLFEEYIEGVPLMDWVSENYPFSNEQAYEDYILRSTAICRQIRDSLIEVHECGLAFGDFQSQNIMLDSLGNVRFIDLEAARPLKDTGTAAVATPGYVGADVLTGEEQDWFAYNRVVIDMFYPLMPMNALSDYLIDYQVQQVNRIFENHVSFPELLAFESMFSRQSELIPCGLSSHFQDLQELRLALQKGIFAMFAEGGKGERIPGDITSFIGLGQYNIEAGLAGICSEVTVREYFQNLPLSSIADISSGGLSRGYLSGIDGILLVRGAPLSRLPFWASDTYDAVDVSLRSGLSGIILTLIASVLNGTEHDGMSLVLTYLEDLKNVVLRDETVLSSPFASSEEPVGLIDGWAGATLALCAGYRVFKKREFLDVARIALKKDMKHLIVAFDGSVQVDDSGRFLPYIAEGSAGIALALLMLGDLRTEFVDDRLIAQITKATKIRCSVNGGFYSGRAGLLAVRYFCNQMGVDGEKIDDKTLLEGLLPYCFYKENTDMAMVPGQGGMKLSADYSTGNEGIIRIIDVIKNSLSPWHLFPSLEVISQLFFSTENNLSLH